MLLPLVFRTSINSALGNPTTGVGSARISSITTSNLTATMVWACSKKTKKQLKRLKQVSASFCRKCLFLNIVYFDQIKKVDNALIRIYVGLKKTFAKRFFCNYFCGSVTIKSKYQTHKETAPLREAVTAFVHV